MWRIRDRRLLGNGEHYLSSVPLTTLWRGAARSLSALLTACPPEHNRPNAHGVAQGARCCEADSTSNSRPPQQPGRSCCQLCPRTPHCTLDCVESAARQMQAAHQAALRAPGSALGARFRYSQPAGLRGAPLSLSSTVRSRAVKAVPRQRFDAHRLSIRASALVATNGNGNGNCNGHAALTFAYERAAAVGGSEVGHVSFSVSTVSRCRTDRAALGLQMLSAHVVKLAPPSTFSGCGRGRRRAFDLELDAARAPERETPRRAPVPVAHRLRRSVAQAL